MPEGDTVLRVARTLHRALAGDVLQRTDFRVPRFATASLAGQGVTEVAARGKHLLLRTDRVLTLHTHLGMEGMWFVYARGERPRGGPAHAIRVILENARYAAVGYRLVTVEVIPTADEGRVLRDLGPDVLGADWDCDEALRRLAADGGRPIGEALLEQRNLAGIGNIYKNESLFLCGVDPRTPARDVADPRALLETARRLMQASVESGVQCTTGMPGPGQRYWVFERAGRPCRRCGSPVAMWRDAGRPTYACPRCQPAG